MIQATGRPRPDDVPEVIPDAKGVTIRFESETTPEFWLECRLELAELDRLTALVEAENTLDRYGDPGDDK